MGGWEEGRGEEGRGEEGREEEGTIGKEGHVLFQAGCLWHVLWADLSHP